MEDAHAGIASDLHLHSDVAGQVSMNLGLLGGMHSGIEGSSRVVKALVPYLINHIII